MAYRIQYGTEKTKHFPPITEIPGRVRVAAVLFAMAMLIRLTSVTGTGMLSRYLDHGPESVMEQAVSAMALALAAGEGWYHGLAIWCATMLSGS